MKETEKDEESEASSGKHGTPSMDQVCINIHVVHHVLCISKLGQVSMNRQAGFVFLR